MVACAGPDRITRLTEDPRASSTVTRQITTNRKTDLGTDQPLIPVTLAQRAPTLLSRNRRNVSLLGQAAGHIGRRQLEGQTPLHLTHGSEQLLCLNNLLQNQSFKILFSKTPTKKNQLHLSKTPCPVPSHSWLA